MRQLVSTLILLFCLVYIASAQENKPLMDFHNSIVKKGKSSQETLSPDVSATQNPHVKLYASVVLASKWSNSAIPVCWENPSQNYADAMEWTRDAVAKTWEKVSAIKLTGWSKCAAINKGIRIQIADAGPHVKQLGRFLDQMKNGMVLNFSFANWSQSCQSNREHCIRAIAVHEFGHAIGFTHEQNRADAPGECRLLAQGSDPDSVLTPYDPSSVMNYCNKNWNNDGFLSSLDIEAVQTLYGKP